jgi:hypothetical protein
VWKLQDWDGVAVAVCLGFRGVILGGENGLLVA